MLVGVSENYVEARAELGNFTTTSSKWLLSLKNPKERILSLDDDEGEGKAGDVGV